jgi:hypothetical protein
MFVIFPGKGYVDAGKFRGSSQNSAKMQEDIFVSTLLILVSHWPAANDSAVTSYASREKQVCKHENLLKDNSKPEREHLLKDNSKPEREHLLKEI